MANRAAQRMSRQQRGQDNRSVGAGEVHSVAEPSAQPVNERWERARAAYDVAVAQGASSNEAYAAAQAAYEA